MDRAATRSAKSQARSICGPTLTPTRSGARYRRPGRSVARRDCSGATGQSLRFPEVVARAAGREYRYRVASVRPGRGFTMCSVLRSPKLAISLESGVFVHNCGIIVNVTPLEPEWEGHVTLEFSNTTPLPAKIYANEGVAQMLFFESDEVCETSYKDRGGKYRASAASRCPRPEGPSGGTERRISALMRIANRSLPSRCARPARACSRATARTRSADTRLVPCDWLANMTVSSAPMRCCSSRCPRACRRKSLDARSLSMIGNTGGMSPLDRSTHDLDLDGHHVLRAGLEREVERLAFARSRGPSASQSKVSS